MITKFKLPDCYGAEEIIMQEVKMVGKQKIGRVLHRVHAQVLAFMLVTRTKRHCSHAKQQRNVQNVC